MQISTTANSGSETDLARYRDARKVTVVGGVFDLLLGVVKIIVGLAAHSQALIADGVHSLSDLATDFLVIYAAKHASRSADPEHPYGHARIETVATVLLGATLIAVAFGIAYDAGRRLFAPDELLHPGMLALIVAAASVVIKEVIYHYTLRAARRLRSDMLRANAWHSRSDAISSIIVIIGVGGTMVGLPYLDAIAAIGVALMIAKIGWDLAGHSVRELIDTGLAADRIAIIEDAIKGVSGVRALHLLRTRKSGSAALVDVHILVDGTVSVSEGHQIGEKVRARLLEEIEEVEDVTVHIDPEDDETCSPSDHLPLREEVLERLHMRWREIADAGRIEHVTLHYLNGRIHVEVQLPLDLARDTEVAGRRVKALIQAAHAEPEIGEVRVWYG